MLRYQTRKRNLENTRQVFFLVATALKPKNHTEDLTQALHQLVTEKPTYQTPPKIQPRQTCEFVKYLSYDSRHENYKFNGHTPGHTPGHTLGHTPNGGLDDSVFVSSHSYIRVPVTVHQSLSQNMRVAETGSYLPCMETARRVVVAPSHTGAVQVTELCGEEPIFLKEDDRMSQTTSSGYSSAKGDLFSSEISSTYGSEISSTYGSEHGSGDGFSSKMMGSFSVEDTENTLKISSDYFKRKFEENRSVFENSMTGGRSKARLSATEHFSRIFNRKKVEELWSLAQTVGDRVRDRLNAGDLRTGTSDRVNHFLRQDGNAIQVLMTLQLMGMAQMDTPGSTSPNHLCGDQCFNTVSGSPSAGACPFALALAAAIKGVDFPKTHRGDFSILFNHNGDASSKYSQWQKFSTAVHEIVDSMNV